eukprot:TRINITY_DN26744_c0_g2_i1.p1 TRINITY_DN26744_c0_g2~~TRINITY_DN26744_c0_g2_i1.p1  ORF type:complete len:181 (+),score=31.28 TRINITY_DN26744_c0_g2_i1:68-610(+)
MCDISSREMCVSTDLLTTPSFYDRSDVESSSRASSVDSFEESWRMNLSVGSFVFTFSAKLKEWHLSRVVKTCSVEITVMYISAADKCHVKTLQRQCNMIQPVDWESSVLCSADKKWRSELSEGSCAMVLCRRTLQWYDAYVLQAFSEEVRVMFVLGRKCATKILSRASLDLQPALHGGST